MLRSLALALAVGALAQAQPAGNLELSTQFDLSSATSTPLRFYIVRAAHGHLYFLGTPKPTVAHAVVLRTDLSGKVDWTINLGPAEFLDFAVTESDGVVVASDPNELTFYDPQGRLVSKSPSDRAIFKLATAGARVIGLGAGAAGATVGDVTSGEPMHFNLDFGEFASQAKFVAIDDATSAYIEPVEAEISLLDMNTGNCIRTPLNHPEVFRIKSDNRASGSGLVRHATGIVVMDATSSNGVVYCALSGFRLVDGVPIVSLRHSL